MTKLSFRILTVSCLVILFAPSAYASCLASQTGELEITRVPGQPLVAVCKGDVIRKVTQVTQIGVCTEFPLTQNSNTASQGLNQCQNLLSAPVDIDLSVGSSIAVEAQAPAPGLYGFFYQLVPARGQYSALWKFSQAIIAGDGTQNIGASQSGSWCFPASFEYTTSTIFDGIRPNVCVDTEPNNLPLSTLFFNNVGYSDWRGILSVAAPDTPPLERQYEINSEVFQNVILLDRDLSFIEDEANKGDTEYVLVIQKLSDPIQITASKKNMTFETTLTDKARVSVGCSGDLNASCVLNTPYTSTTINLILD